MRTALLAIVLFVAYFQMNAMDDNPHINIATQRENTEHSLLKTKIEKCTVCDKETTQRCNACQLTFYCSAECQTENWDTHKKVCKAQQSDIEHIKNAFCVFFAKALETGEQKYIAQAISFHTQALIRIDQDKACAHDESISSLHVMLEGRQLLDNLITLKICNIHDVQEMLRQAVPQAVAQVKQRTINNKLVPPYGVSRYSMKPSINTEPRPDEFIPASEWREQRLAVIAAFEEKFKLKNNIKSENV